MSEILLPMFSSRIFMVSGQIFKSLIHFECILVCDVEGGLVSFFSHICPISLTLFIE